MSRSIAIILAATVSASLGYECTVVARRLQRRAPCPPRPRDERLRQRRTHWRSGRTGAPRRQGRLRTRGGLGRQRKRPPHADGDNLSDCLADQGRDERRGLVLLEEGKLDLTDPVSRFIPTFAKSTVAVTRDDGSTSCRRGAQSRFAIFSATPSGISSGTNRVGCRSLYQSRRLVRKPGSGGTRRTRTKRSA